MAGALFLLAAMASGPVPAVGAVEIALRDRHIRLGDIVAVSRIAAGLSPLAASRVVATIPAGRTQVSLSRAALAGLVRRNVPGLRAAALPGDGSVTFRSAAAKAEKAKGPCLSLAQPVAEGAALKAEDVTEVACGDGAAVAALRYDRRASAVRASAPLSAGTMLGRVALTSGPDVEAGAKLTLVSAIGPVRIERHVEALQAGRSGSRVFVRDADGQVLAVSLSIPKAPEEPR